MNSETRSLTVAQLLDVLHFDISNQHSGDVSNITAVLMFSASLARSWSDKNRGANNEEFLEWVGSAAFLRRVYDHFLIFILDEANKQMEMNVHVSGE